MNETYKLPFTAKEIEDKLTNGCGLELIGTYDLASLERINIEDNYYYDGWAVWELFGAARVVILNVSNWERRSISWNMIDNNAWYGGPEVDFSFNAGNLNVSDAIENILSQLSEWSAGEFMLEFYV